MTEVEDKSSGLLEEVFPINKPERRGIGRVQTSGVHYAKKRILNG